MCVTCKSAFSIYVTLQLCLLHVSPLMLHPLLPACSLTVSLSLSLCVLSSLSLLVSLILFSGYRIIELRVRVSVRWTMRQRLASKVPAQHSS